MMLGFCEGAYCIHNFKTDLKEIHDERPEHQDTHLDLFELQVTLQN